MLSLFRINKHQKNLLEFFTVEFFSCGGFVIARKAVAGAGRENTLPSMHWFTPQVPPVGQAGPRQSLKCRPASGSCMVAEIHSPSHLGLPPSIEAAS